MSRFIISILLFFAVNLLAAKALLHISETHSSSQLGQAQERTWTQWALADFEKQKERAASIVILGSSLVLTPVNLADANFSNSTINGALHHKSDLLNNLLKAGKESGASNFNFALPGLMPSDAYLITKLVLSKSRENKLIVYGVGPRDFVDNLLASPASTDPYHCLSKSLNELNDRQAILSFVGKNWQSQLDYLIGYLLPLYGEKEMLLDKLCQDWQCVIAPLLASIFPSSLFNRLTMADVHNFLPNYNPMSININQALFVPNPKIDPDRFNKNINEYKARYRQVNWDTFTCQSQFFVDFLKTARDRNIKVLIVAMPITSINRQLLPDYIYSAYKQNLAVLTKTYGAAFMDLDSNGEFNDADFGDTVHLGTTGSIRLMHSIANGIIQGKLLEASKTDRKRLAQAGLKL